MNLVRQIHTGGVLPCVLAAVVILACGCFPTHSENPTAPKYRPFPRYGRITEVCEAEALCCSGNCTNASVSLEVSVPYERVYMEGPLPSAPCGAYGGLGIRVRNTTNGSGAVGRAAERPNPITGRCVYVWRSGPVRLTPGANEIEVKSSYGGESGNDFLTIHYLSEDRE